MPTVMKAQLDRAGPQPVVADDLTINQLAAGLVQNPTFMNHFLTLHKASITEAQASGSKTSNGKGVEGTGSGVCKQLFSNSSQLGGNGNGERTGGRGGQGSTDNNVLSKGQGTGTGTGAGTEHGVGIGTGTEVGVGARAGGGAGSGVRTGDKAKAQNLLALLGSNNKPAATGPGGCSMNTPSGRKTSTEAAQAEGKKEKRAAALMAQAAITTGLIQESANTPEKAKKPIHNAAATAGKVDLSAEKTIRKRTPKQNRTTPRGGRRGGKTQGGRGKGGMTKETGEGTEPMEEGEVQEEGEGMDEDEEDIPPTQVVTGFTQEQQTLLLKFLPTKSLQDVQNFVDESKGQPAVLHYLLKRYLPENPKEITQEGVTALADLLWEGKALYEQDFEQFKGGS